MRSKKKTMAAGLWQDKLVSLCEYCITVISSEEAELEEWQLQ
jgi:hypothetical protein